MNIAIICPRISVRERYGVDIGEIGGRQAPLGVLYLSSFLKKSAHNVIVIDAASEELSDTQTLLRVKKHNSEIVGISSTSVALRNSQILAQKIKKETSAKTVLGGPHISANPDDFSSLKEFDFAITGEGERAFANFAETLESGKNDFTKIPNLLWRKNNNIIKNHQATLIEDMDSLPFPDRDALPDLRLYRPPIMCYLREPVVSIITSRGCPYKCVFCDKAVFGNKIRFFSPDYVLSEIEMIQKKYKAQELAFVDDTFPCNKKRFIKILEGMIKKKFNLKWSCMANANDLDNETLKLMKKAGCWQIAIGIESGDDKILQIIKKKSNTKTIAKIAIDAHKCGIYVKGFFMLGHPGETKETIERSRNFALSIPLSDVTCTIATPIKGSEFYRMALSGEYGKLKSNLNSSELNYWEPVFIPNGLNAKILLTAQKRFFKSFYLRPSILIRQIAKIRSLTAFFRIIKTIPKITTAKKIKPIQNREEKQ